MREDPDILSEGRYGLYHAVGAYSGVKEIFEYCYGVSHILVSGRVFEAVAYPQRYIKRIGGLAGRGIWQCAAALSKIGRFSSGDM